MNKIFSMIKSGEFIPYLPSLAKLLLILENNIVVTKHDFTIAIKGKEIFMAIHE